MRIRLKAWRGIAILVVIVPGPQTFSNGVVEAKGLFFARGGHNESDRLCTVRENVFHLMILL